MGCRSKPLYKRRFRFRPGKIVESDDEVVLFSKHHASSIDGSGAW